MIRVAEGSLFTYEILDKIAAAGTSDVFRARAVGKARGARYSALKLSRPGKAAHVLKDAAIRANLSHPNVVGLEDFGTYGGRPFLVMELVEGWTLGEIIRLHFWKRTQMPIGVSLRLMAACCEGLANIHDATDNEGRRLDLVHCSLAPDNILVGLAGEVKVTDLGGAVATRECRGLEGSLRGGDYYYMSPEQAADSAVDRRSDLFTVGLLLYECLTLRPTYDVRVGRSVVTAARECRVQEAVQIVSAAPGGEAAAVVAGALAKRPRDRFQSAQEMAGALRGAMAEGQEAGEADYGEWLEMLRGCSRAETE